MKKNKNAFTLIEILAIIVILAIIALIAIPNISEQFDYSKRESIKRTVDSLVRSYEYKELNSNARIGRQDACNFQDGECTFNGYIDRNSEDKIIVYINTLKGCASGTIDDLKITDTTCGGEDNTPPIIRNVQFASVTTDSITVLVQIEENESMIESAKFRLLDRNGTPVSGWQSEDYTYETDGLKIAKKTYSDLTLGTDYYLEIEVKNTGNNNNTVSKKYSEGTAIKFTTLGFNRPTITYDTTKWETTKTVTITYDSTFQNKENKYRTQTTNQVIDTDWTVVNDNSKVLQVTKYQYIVDAKSSAGSSVLNTSSRIGYVDNENDVLNPKPTIEPLNYKNTNGINSNLVSLRLKDDKSGIAYYCVTTSNNVANCSGTGNNTQLNKWVLAVTNASDLGKANKEIRDRTVQHQFENAGIYYVFLKDAVGNISDGQEVDLYKISYDLNGGTGTVNYQIKLKGSDLVLSDVTPTRSGYVFLGWDTNKSRRDGSAAYAKKGTYRNDSDVTLYAIWRKTVTITYNSNGGTGSVASVSCYRYNAEETCPITFNNGSALSRTGYTFEGWAKGQNNYAVAYTKGTKYNIAESETVYAGWKAKELTWSDQSFTKEYSNENQVISITAATNGNTATQYTKVSEVQGSTNTTRINVNSSNGALTVTGTTPSAQYKVTVKATLPVSNTINGATEVTATKTMTVKINAFTIPTLDPDDPSNTDGVGLKIADIAAVTYKHAAYTPEPVVTVVTTKGATPKALVKGTDFDYSYSNNTNKGTATVKVTLKGNYSGNRSKNFTINAYNISGVDIAAIDAVTYKAAAYTPTPTVTAFKGQTNQEVLVSGTDFTYSYTNNTNAGTATVTISGKNANYTGTKSTTFTINKKALTVSWGTNSFTYNNSNQKPTASVNTGFSGKTLTITTDGAKKNVGTNYTSNATCSDNTDLCSNYSLSGTSKTFSISAYNMSGTTISGVNSTYDYTGADITPTPTITANNFTQTLTSGTDYTLSYSNNKVAGTATITATGKGNFTGTKTATFTIKKIAGSGTFSCASLTYNGSSQAVISTQTTTNAELYYSYTTQLNSSNYTNTSVAKKLNIASGEKPVATNAGTYTVYWYAPADSGHNEYTATTPNCKINQKTLSITASDQEVSYGTGITNTTAKITSSGLVSGHSITAITLTPSTSNVPGGTITPSAATVKSNGTDVTANYSISYNNGNLKINKVDATCPTLSDYNAAYDGAAHSIGSSGGIGGTVQYKTTGGWGNTNPTATNVSTTTVSVQVAGDGNHNTKSCGSKTLKISARGLTITASNQSVSYGTAITTGTGKITSSGLVSGHSVTAITLTPSTNNVPGGTITPSAATVKSGSTDVTSNYSISYVNGTLTISKVASTCPTISNNTKTYDGTTKYINVSGGSGGTIQYKYGSNAWSNSNHGMTDVGATTISVRVVGDSNHTDQSNCGSATVKVEPKSLAITWGSTTSFVYNGSEQKPSASVASTGISGQTMNISVSGGTNVGSYTARATCASVTNGSCDNYLLSGSTKAMSITNASFSAGSVSITGTNKVNQTLTATYSSTPSVTPTFQWYRGSTAISGATGSTYVVTASDIGSTIKVVATFTKANYTTITREDTTDATNNGSATSKAAVKAVKQVCKSTVGWVYDNTTYFTANNGGCPSTYGNDNHNCNSSSDAGNKYMTSCSVEEVAAWLHEITGSYSTNYGKEYTWPSDTYFSCTKTPNTTGQRYRVGGAQKAYTQYENVLLSTSYGLSSCESTSNITCNSSYEGHDVYSCSYDSSTGKWTKKHERCQNVQYWKWDEAVCTMSTKVFLYYYYCGATYGFVDDKANYPDTYPDTCVESTPTCNSSSNVGNIKVTCVNE